MATQEQRKYLRERLQNAMYDRRKAAESAADTRDTAAVKSARSIVKRFDAMAYERKRAAVKVVEKEYAKIKETLLFSEPKDALAAIKKFESK